MKPAMNEYLQERMPFYIEVLREMVEINSFTSNASGVNRLGERTAEFFGNLGFIPEFVQSSNPNFGRHLFLRMGQPNSEQTQPPVSIAMISHLDTVFTPEEEEMNDFRFRIEGERIYGPGTVDIKGGTVMIYAVLDAIRFFFPDAYYSTDWLIGLDASEETLSVDFGDLCLQRLDGNTKACLVFEGGTPSRKFFPIVTSRKGRAEFEVRVQGRSAHAGNYHKQGANAIVQIADTIQQIASLTDYENQITFNVGVVNGGSVVNRVPHHAEALVEMRAFSSEVFEEGVEKILRLNGNATITSHDGYPCSVSIRCKSRTDPWPRNPKTDSLYEIWRNVGATLDLAVVPEERGGLSDGNLLWRHYPTVDGLGPAGTNAHCSERSVDGTKDQEYMLIPYFIPKAILNVQSILHLIRNE